MATTPKGGSRRANCPLMIPALRQQRRMATWGFLRSSDVSNGCHSKPAMSIYWRISLVPAPAVIPAPEVYTNVAAVETLVVDCGYEIAIRLQDKVDGFGHLLSQGTFLSKFETETKSLLQTILCWTGLAQCIASVACSTLKRDRLLFVTMNKAVCSEVANMLAT